MHHNVKKRRNIPTVEKGEGQLVAHVKLVLDLGHHDGLEPEFVVTVLWRKSAGLVPILEKDKRSGFTVMHLLISLVWIHFEMLFQLHTFLYSALILHITFSSTGFLDHNAETVDFFSLSFFLTLL